MLRINQIQLQVSSNGLISFRAGYSSFRPREFTREFDFFQFPIIAPLWADFDTRTSGSIFYRVTDDPQILQKIISAVTEINSIYSSYSPQLAFVATWERITPFSDSQVICING